MTKKKEVRNVSSRAEEVKNISPKVEAISSEEFGEIIGADRMFKLHEGVFKITIVQGKKEEKMEIREIPEKDLSSYTLMGTAEGADPYHCLYLASKFAKDFRKRVAGYRRATSQREKCPVAFSFYEKKETSP